MRSFWKGPFIDKTIEKHKLQDDYNMEIRSRRSTILPFLVNKTFKIYNGHKYAALTIAEHHVGYKFGDFVLTKKRCVFKRGKKKK
jgi:small subunit ribosomal protein S19